METDPAARTAKRLLILTIGLAFVPFFGAAVWLIAAPLLFVAFILAIVAMSRTGKGIGLLFFILIIAPCAIVAGPFIGTAVFGLTVSSAVPFVKLPHKAANAPAVALRDIPKGPAADAAKVRAATKYPRLRIAGSPEHTEFLKTVELCRKEMPRVFDDADWPTVIADAVFQPSPKTQQTQPPVSGPGRTWTYVPGLGRYIEHDSSVSSMRSIGGGG